MDFTFTDMKAAQKAVIFMDDMIVHVKTLKELHANVSEFLSICKKRKLMITTSQIHFQDTGGGISQIYILSRKAPMSHHLSRSRQARARPPARSCRPSARLFANFHSSRSLYILHAHASSLGLQKNEIHRRRCVDLAVVDAGVCARQ